jgi:macrolide transport system ATP-binding/permease protein
MLEARGIEYSYRLGSERQQILFGVDIRVADGEMVAIQGPSGSGKSTLLYLLGGLLNVDAGSVKIQGTEITTMDEDSLARFRNEKLGFVFQQFHLLPRATVLENILLPTIYPAETAEQTPADIARAKELAELVGLGHRLDHMPNQLSGGQQQRVAIARALMKNPRLILADEPTGNLDSKAALSILALLKDLHAKGITIVIITHDSTVAAQCQRTVHIRDGLVESAEGQPSPEYFYGVKSDFRAYRSVFNLPSFLDLCLRQLPAAAANLKRSRLRSFLTMLGIIIGIGAVLSMITLGNFAKQKILDSYADLGVNTMRFYGSRNWELKATDQVPGVFTAFNWDRDILPLRHIFPQIGRITPMLSGWDAKVKFAGRSVEEGRMIGMNEDGIVVNGRALQMGKNFTAAQVSLASPVCIVGYEIVERVMRNTQPIGQVIRVDAQDASFGCRVIGVLKKHTSNKDWDKPNLQIVVPFTFFRRVMKQQWYNRIFQVLIQVKPGTDLEKTGKGLRRYFEMRYGASGRFRVDNDSVLISQMKRFLTIFTLLLSSIALLSLAVGGIGIANMMLVSVNERFREIGLRKALGATPASIRAQLLTESVVLCGIGGLMGVSIGLAGYHLIIYAASRVIPKFEFAWVLDSSALFVSAVAILTVGVLSGLFPALKAERLQVIEALRSE